MEIKTSREIGEAVRRTAIGMDMLQEYKEIIKKEWVAVDDLIVKIKELRKTHSYVLGVDRFEGKNQPKIKDIVEQIFKDFEELCRK